MVGLVIRPPILQHAFYQLPEPDPPANPYGIKLSCRLTLIKPGENELKIEVVNNWPNRLIGDAKLPADQRRTRTNITKYNPPKTGEHPPPTLRPPRPGDDSSGEVNLTTEDTENPEEDPDLSEKYVDMWD